MPAVFRHSSSVPAVSTLTTMYSLAVPSWEMGSFSHSVMLWPARENSKSPSGFLFTLMVKLCCLPELSSVVSSRLNL